MKFNLFQRVRLSQDLPEYQLKRGDIGTIVEYYHHLEGEDGYSLEGLIPLDTVEVWESQIELVSPVVSDKQMIPVEI
jgi:hypothetical protein